MPSEKVNFLNRKIINDPKMQYGIVGFFVGMALVNLIFFIVALKLMKNQFMNEIEPLESSSKIYVQNVLENLSHSMLKTTWTFGAFVIVFSVLAGLLLLQNISGPAYSIKRYLENILEGKPSDGPLRLRKYDFFHPIADLINKIHNKQK